ncbi:unnamed protein product, partial [Rotaria sordida]
SNRIALSVSGAEAFFDLFDRIPTIDNTSTEGQELVDFRGEIKFDQVKFIYPSRPTSIILNKFQLNIKPSQRVALVGASGCGKSTIIQLLERFYDVTSGQLFLDGIDIRQLNLQWVRSHFGLVSQEPILFDLTIAENIAYGLENVSMEDIINAARKANIHQFIEQLPQGYETKVGLKGSFLSGGEKQRIAIARVLLRRPKVLLLDEATSAMDSYNEQIKKIMFQTTNVTSSAVPNTAVVRPSFQIMNASTNHHTLVPSSSSTNPSWCLTTPTPSVVSILNGNSSTFYIATQSSPTTTNIIRQSTQTVRHITPSFTILNNSNTTISGQNPIISSSNNSLSSDTCVDTSFLGRLTTSTIQRQQIPSENLEEQTSLLGNDIDIDRNQHDSEIELFVNNVVCSFALGCKLNLRKIAMEAANVIYKRDHAMVLMKMRNPYCSANVWSSGKVIVTGTTSEDDAQRAARRIARCLQRLGFKIKFRNYRIVNCLATCSMPWPIDIIKLSRIYPECVSYEPEIHPGATVRLNNKVVLKVFTTGSITLTAPSVELINTAVNEFYPQLYECRKVRQINKQHH